ncbi:MAG TPA: ATP-grasp domain-containing protein [Nitrososphaeraceae archaeon]|nr:ATP-grasp domain-containing protein [Nitrososphaeraceae archaeon]
MSDRKVSTILVPGAAAPAGINAIKSLRMGGFQGKIVATDSSYLSPGFFMCEVNEVIPEADNHSFIDRLNEIVEKYGVNLLLPTSGFDIYPYSEFRDQLIKRGAFPVVSDMDSLVTCKDKKLTYERLKSKFDLPFTTTDPNEISSFPVMAKPRYGKGSRDIMRLDNTDDIGYVTSKMKDLIFQEFLPGTEYTIDVLSDLDKKAILAVPRIRIQTKAGISTKGRILKNRRIEEECKQIADFIGIRGPCCIQMKEDANGIIKLVEINPRMGGGTIFTTLAGANFPMMLIDMVEHKQVKMPEVNEITVIRYYEEIVIRAAADHGVLSAEQDILTKSNTQI